MSQSPGPQPVLVLEYATPQGLVPVNGILVKNGLICGDSHMDLPERCVICNAPSKNMLEKKLWWHHPAIIALILLNLLIYAIVALCVRKSGTVNYYECDAHRQRRRRWALIAALLALLGVGVGIGTGVLVANRVIAEDYVGIGIIAGVLMALLALIFGIVKGSAPLKPKYIDRTSMHLKGAGQPFLDSLCQPPPLAQPVSVGQGM